MIDRRGLLGLSIAAVIVPTVTSAQTVEDLVGQMDLDPIPVTDAERTLWRSLLNAEHQAKAADEIIARPDTINPLAFALVAESLWTRGDRTKAAFWFYLFQARTQPWLAGGPISATLLQDYLAMVLGRPRDYAALRRTYNTRVRETVNTWAMSDLDALQALAIRVFSYERRVPLSPARFPFVSEETWAATVEGKRVENEQAFKEVIGGLDREGFYAERRARGLYVGPWKDPGAPLPDDWR